MTLSQQVSSHFLLLACKTLMPVLLKSCFLDFLLQTANTTGAYPSTFIFQPLSPSHTLSPLHFLLQQKQTTFHSVNKPSLLTYRPFVYSLFYFLLQTLLPVNCYSAFRCHHRWHFFPGDVIFPDPLPRALFFLHSDRKPSYVFQSTYHSSLGKEYIKQLFWECQAFSMLSIQEKNGEIARCTQPG